jgi:phospholipid/cholesterol/gamma-HCH transport system substrate-binding protein
VGKVAEIRLDPQTDAAILTLRIQKGVALTDDVIASVKTSGLIGDKYVKLAQGGSPDMLADGDRITETESAVDIQDLIGKYAFGDVEKK